MKFIPLVAASEKLEAVKDIFNYGKNDRSFTYF